MADAESSIDLGIDGLGPAEHIGRGGFADVYRAEQISLRRTVAVKVLRSQATDPGAEARFQRECHAIGAVSDHPYIVGVHEGGFTRNGRAYLVMEYLPGGSLADRIRDDGPMPVDEIVNTGLKIGKALSVAHRTGVLHRDVKPANIMISAYGEPALGDFGIARIEGGPQTASGLVTASLAHVAPDVLGGDQPSPASDIYSLASTMFELLTGRPPYYNPDDETIWPLMKRILSEPFPSPESVGLSARLGAVFQRATARHVVDRYGSAEQFVDDLDALVSDPLALTRYPGTDQKLTSLPGRTEDGPMSRGIAKQNDDPAATTLQPSGPPPATRPDLTSANHLTETRAARVADPAETAVPVGGDGVDRGARPVLAGSAPKVESAGGPHPAPTQELPKITPADRRSGGGGRRTAPLLAGFVLIVALIGAVGWLLRDRIADIVGPGGNGSTASVLIPDAIEGPLQAGEDYRIIFDGVQEGSTVRIVVDGVPRQSEPASVESTIEAVAGHHSVAVEITEPDGRVTTTDATAYLATESSQPGPGYRAVLATIAAEDGWSATLQAGEALSGDGHADLELIASDSFPELTSGRWLLAVDGFGLDADGAGEAESYCADADLEAPLGCYVAGLGLTGG